MYDVGVGYSILNFGIRKIVYTITSTNILPTKTTTHRPHNSGILPTFRILSYPSMTHPLPNNLNTLPTHIHIHILNLELIT